MLRACVCCLALVAGVIAVPAGQGVRVVDAVNVGAPDDEAAHHFAGEQTTIGQSGGRKWRSAAAWFSYSLRIYDDSPLTIVCVVADGDGTRESFDILVDGRKAGTVTREPAQTKAAELRVNLRLQDTEGRTSVVVKLVAHSQSKTARLLELRTLQEHLE